MHLMNTHWSIILPAVFSTFPVFIMYRGFAAIPKELYEAAKIDGAGDWQTFIRIGIPLGSPGILSALVLGFLEYWNMVEQPLAFLEDLSLWPLSLYLPEIDLRRAGMALAASVITLIPAVFVFFMGQDYLESGITASGMKE
jgi:multiple sugar transport system permease protein